VGLAGTCKLGRHVILTGQVGAAGHLTVGDNVVVTPQSGIPSDIEPNRTVSGSPVMDHMVWLKCSAIYPRLPEMYATFRKVKDLLAKMKESSA
jgi:UDP-3-O-[3-hydroxymyristoyl] glucosamine N-acyltransferase